MHAVAQQEVQATMAELSMFVQRAEEREKFVW